MTDIVWTEEVRSLKDLKPYEKNPRRITKTHFEKLLDNITKCGYNNRLLINADNTIVGGHARLKALKQLGHKEVKVLVPNRQLTEEEFKRILVTDNIHFGEFDLDMLANDFDADQLKEWGFNDAALPNLSESLTDDDLPMLTEEDVIVWMLGAHTLMAGNIPVVDMIDKLIDYDTPILMIAERSNCDSIIKGWEKLTGKKVVEAKDV